MQKILTLDEAKLIVGESESDSKLRFFLNSAHQVLLDILGIADLGTHTVTDERVKVLKNSIYLNDFPVSTSNITLKKTSDRTTEDDYGYTFAVEDDYKLVIPDKQFFRYSEYLITYTAGYTLKDVLEITDNTGLTDKTIVIEEVGEQTTYTLKASGATGNQINIGADADETASNIATKLGGTSTDAEVTLPLGTLFIGEDSTIPSGNYTHTPNNIPYNLKYALGLIISGMIADRQKAGGVIEYTVSKKTVRFASGADRNSFNETIKDYINRNRYSYHA